MLEYQSGTLISLQVSLLSRCIKGRDGGGEREFGETTEQDEFSSSFPILSPLYTCYAGYLQVVTKDQTNNHLNTIMTNNELYHSYHAKFCG